jgi:hypothetical protein
MVALSLDKILKFGCGVSVQAKFEVEKYVYARNYLRKGAKAQRRKDAKTQRRKDAKKAFEARQRFAPLRLCVSNFLAYAHFSCKAV